jgi:PAS domain S-box-containing protein
VTETINQHASFVDAAALQARVTELEAQVAELKLVLDHLPQGIFWKDTTLKYRGCNQRAARHAGLTSSDAVVGRTDYELEWKAIAEAYRADDRQVLESGQARTNFEEEIEHADGSVSYVTTTKVPLRDAAGRIVGILGTYQNVDERRRGYEALRASEEQFSLAMRGTYDGIWDCDLASRQIVFSSRLKSMLGRSLDVLGSDSHELQRYVHPDDLPRVTQALRAYLAGQDGRFEVECRLLHVDGTYRHVLAHGVAVRTNDATPTRFVGTVTDISVLKATELSLQNTVEELRRSNEELERFAYVASHDLQEPLRMVASFTELLAERYSEKLDDKAKQYIAYAVDGAHRMQTLINDLLALSRVGVSSLPLKPLESREIVAEVLQAFQSTILELGATVVLGELPRVRANATELRQLFQNLIGNALKFHGDAAPHVEVRAKLEGAEWCFQVRDNGIGIAPEYHERIFIVFQRLHARGRYPGNGMGLAIAKKIVERHGGKIWVASEPGSGSCFMFTLPAAIC